MSDYPNSNYIYLLGGFVSIWLTYFPCLISKKFVYLSVSVWWMYDNMFPKFFLTYNSQEFKDTNWNQRQIYKNPFSFFSPLCVSLASKLARRPVIYKEKFQKKFYIGVNAHSKRRLKTLSKSKKTWKSTHFLLFSVNKFFPSNYVANFYVFGWLFKLIFWNKRSSQNSLAHFAA